MSAAEISEQGSGGLWGEGLSKAQSGGPGLGGGRWDQGRLFGLGNQSRKYQVRLEELEDDRLGSEEPGGWALGSEGPVLCPTELPAPMEMVYICAVLST